MVSSTLFCITFNQKRMLLYSALLLNQSLIRWNTFLILLSNSNKQIASPCDTEIVKFGTCVVEFGESKLGRFC